MAVTIFFNLNIKDEFRVEFLQFYLTLCTLQHDFVYFFLNVATFLLVLFIFLLKEITDA